MPLPEPAPAVEDDTDYVPEVVVLTEGVLFYASTVPTDLAKCLDASLVSTLKRNRLEDLNAKAKEMKESFKMKFAEVAAPGQEEEFLAELLSSDDDESDDRENKVPKELDGLLSKYQSGNWISEIFGCSLYMIKEAVSLSKEEWQLRAADINKCEHFLYHLFDNGIIQEVAFGTRRLKFDSGEVKEVPWAILTCKYSHAIAKKVAKKVGMRH